MGRGRGRGEGEMAWKGLKDTEGNRSKRKEEERSKRGGGAVKEEGGRRREPIKRKKWKRIKMRDGERKKAEIQGDE